MKAKLTALLAAVLLLAAPAACNNDEGGCACEKNRSSTASSAKPADTHPLKGVIKDVLPDKSALLVKHEAIPGVMAAMTMLFQVDAATLASARKGQAITARMSKRADGWWLADVKPAPATP